VLLPLVMASSAELKKVCISVARPSMPPLGGWVVLKFAQALAAGRALIVAARTRTVAFLFLVLGRSAALAGWSVRGTSVPLQFLLACSKCNRVNVGKS